MPTRTNQPHLGVILSGVGIDQNGWRHPDLPGDASANIDRYIEANRRWRRNSRGYVR